VTRRDAQEHWRRRLGHVPSHFQPDRSDVRRDLGARGQAAAGQRSAASRGSDRRPHEQGGEGAPRAGRSKANEEAKALKNLFDIQKLLAKQAEVDLESAKPLHHLDGPTSRTSSATCPTFRRSCSKRCGRSATRRRSPARRWPMRSASPAKRWHGWSKRSRTIRAAEQINATVADQTEREKQLSMLRTQTTAAALAGLKASSRSTVRDIARWRRPRRPSPSCSSSTRSNMSRRARQKCSPNSAFGPSPRSPRWWRSWPRSASAADRARRRPRPRPRTCRRPPAPEPCSAIRRPSRRASRTRST
jgi:hypothetical protein